MGLPVPASQISTASFSAPVTMRCPSGLNATLDTASVCPTSGGPTGAVLRKFLAITETAWLAWWGWRCSAR